MTQRAPRGARCGLPRLCLNVDAFTCGASLRSGDVPTGCGEAPLSRPEHDSSRGSSLLMHQERQGRRLESS